ncbi:MAG: 3'-5' exonuclease [Anaerolineae bacterium]|nr:MAG: 3'-5' exonuclease [Anaerolineae bacterium]
MGETFISVDVETSGPIPGRYSMLSLGACLVERPEEGFYVEFKPVSQAFEAEALAVSGLSLQDLAIHGLPPKEAMQRFATWIARLTPSGERAVMVGYNVAFDWAFVNHYFLHYLGYNPFGHAPLDVKSFYMGLTGVPWNETGTASLPRRYMDGKQLPHNALEDARMQARAFRRMLEEARRR